MICSIGSRNPQPLPFEMLSSFLFTLAASACLHFTAASPVYANRHTRDLKMRATSNCSSLSANTGCWDELDIPNYLAGWNRTTPTCQASDDGSNCCQSQEPWTTCFLRLAYGGTGSDCTTFNPQTCTVGPLSPNLDPSIAPMVGYVVRNIVAINSAITSYFQGKSR